MQTGEDCRHDPDHPFSPFIHEGLSYTFRLIFASVACYPTRRFCLGNLLRQVGGFSFDFCYSQERFGALVFVLTRVSQMPATC